MTRWVWEPSAEVIERSNVYRMIRKYGFRDYADFWRRSVEDVAWFWQVMERELDLVWQKPYERVLDTSQGWAWARWFIGGRFNLTYNCLDKHVAAGRSSKVAFIWEGEDGRTERWTYGDLTRWTLRVSHALKDLGLRPGDRVGLFLPMVSGGEFTVQRRAGRHDAREEDGTFDGDHQHHEQDEREQRNDAHRLQAQVDELLIGVHRISSKSE